MRELFKRWWRVLVPALVVGTPLVWTRYIRPLISVAADVGDAVSASKDMVSEEPPKQAPCVNLTVNLTVSVQVPKLPVYAEADMQEGWRLHPPPVQPDPLKPPPVHRLARHRPTKPAHARIVKPGESLAIIAHRDGNLAWAMGVCTGLADSDHIEPGQTVLVPSRLSDGTWDWTGCNARSHVVVDGESLTIIADHDDHLAWAIGVCSDLSDPDYITPGQTVLVPWKTPDGKIDWTGCDRTPA